MIFSFLVITIFLSSVFFILAKRQWRQRGTHVESDIAWTEMAEGIFERHESSPQKDRVELALQMGMRKLGIGNAILTVQRGEQCEILRVVSEGYASGFVAGQIVNRSDLYCGMMNENRNAISIDYAGVSEWRKHAAYQLLGWEAYVGVLVPFAAGQALTLGFFQTRAREALFSKSEKDFVRQLALWVAAVLQRGTQESIAGKISDGIDDTAAPTA